MSKFNLSSVKNTVISAVGTAVSVVKPTNKQDIKMVAVGAGSLFLIQAGIKLAGRILRKGK